MDGRHHDGHDGFSHEALFYRDADDYSSAVLDFVRPGLDAGEPVVVAVPPRGMELVRRAIGGEGEQVRLLDMSELGRNPARIIPAVLDLTQKAQDAAPGTTMHFVGEPIWPQRTRDEIREATRHEALINLAWSDAPLRVLCPYDTAGLDDDVLRDAARTHPHLRDAQRAWTSERYEGQLPPLSCEAELEHPPPDAPTMAIGIDDLPALRRLVAASATQLDGERARDLVLATNELATNALRHGGGDARIWIWRDAGDLVCEVAGRGELVDPLVGRRRPSDGPSESRGLWIVNQVCDLVQARNAPDGLAVRVRMRMTSS